MTEYETRLRNAMRELEQHPDVQIYFIDAQEGSEELGNPESILREVGDALHVDLPESMGACLMRYTSLACHWRIEREDFKITGEFNLHHLLKTAERPPPALDWDNTAREQDLYRQFRVMDDFPGGGTASYVALRISPELPAPQVWYHNMRRGAFQMDLDYCAYIDMLPITKGVGGWQYLFSDVSFEGSGFRNFGKRLKRMLEVFPEFFPSYDYSDLRARLEARL
ncbi:hypothetical protein [Streptomyces rhizosphaericus]|uniref:Uncharacterized protein n=1 Tax=Streptomyces rhizosphaericus TaxID=114699 RepID=A0A6G4AS37_9ACTN|nr:hypothetical protein [Streptomyces rhizosphaericus]NEW75594.1 hypothetical protein [Streptomyces rhizosphaericus]